MSGKKFRMIDVLLSVVTSVLVCEAVAPAAAIGNAQFFWWAILIVAFLLPYGMVVAELATTYDDEGGLFDWIRRAFGDNWGSRVSWYYWINFPLWVASLAILFSDTIAVLAGVSLGTPIAIAIQLAFIWGVALISFSKVSDAAWLLNLTAAVKVIVVILVGALGIWYAENNGFAGNMSPHTFLPSFDADGLTYLSIILFNFMGFEVVATFTGSMADPKKQIPIAIIVGGLGIAALYLFGAFGVGAAIPSSQISLDSGLLDAVGIILGQASPLFVGIAVAFLFTFIGTMVCWSYGANYVADYAAKKGDMPKLFDGESKSGAPRNATIICSVVASALCLVAPVMDLIGMSSLFWVFFSLNVVFLIISYVPMFPAFLKLRSIDPDRPRPFRVPGNGIVLKVIAYLPAVLIILSIIATVVPLNGSEAELSKLPSLIGTIAVLVIGELLRVVLSHQRKVDYLGMDKSGDSETWDIDHGYIEKEE